MMLKELPPEFWVEFKIDLEQAVELQLPNAMKLADFCYNGDDL